MTRPLNDDGTVPLKRRLRLCLQVVEGNDVICEVTRNVKPKWMPTDPTGFDEMTPLEKMSIDVEGMINEQVSMAMGLTASELVPEMTKELLGRMKK